MTGGGDRRFFGRRALVIGVMTGSLTWSGCSPLYLPPVPTPLEQQARLEVGGEALVVRGRPALRLELRTVPSPGWLAVQWFSPANREAASQSLWIEPAREGAELEVVLPDDVESRPGRWRAVVSEGGVVARQFSVEVPNGEADPGPADPEGVEPDTVEPVTSEPSDSAD